MKKHQNIVVVALVAALLGGMGCRSPEEKVEDAQEKLHAAEQQLEQARKDSMAVAEWKAFKVAAELEIATNNKVIAEMRAAQKGKTDPAYERQIAELEEENRNLQRKIDFYEKYHSDWGTFQREMAREMEALRKKLESMDLDRRW